MTPDRVIVGEVRGSEVVPMLNAMSQGNDGSMTTIHASSSRGAFMKVASYAAQSAEHLSLEDTNLLIAGAGTAAQPGAGLDGPGRAERGWGRSRAEGQPGLRASP